MPTSELVNIIFNFCEVCSGVTFFKYQEQFSRRVIRSVLENDGDEITSLWARQAGKSTTVAITVGGMMIIIPQLANMPMFADDRRLEPFKEGIYVGVFAPSLRQAGLLHKKMKKVVEGKRAQEILREFGIGYSVSNNQAIALTSGSSAVALSAGEQSNIEGEGFHIGIIDEAQDVSAFKIKKSIQPMMSFYNGSTVKIGTSTTFIGDFYQAIERNKKDWEAKRIPRRNHFEYDYKVVSKYNPKYALYSEKMKNRMGEKSDEFQMSYLLKWVISRGMFVDINVFEVDNGDEQGDLLQGDFFGTYVAGIDLGGSNDSTVITVCSVDWSSPAINEMSTDNETGEDVVYTAYETKVVAWYEIKGEPDFEVQYSMIMDYLSNWNLARVVCDSTREKAVSDRLAANLKCEVVPYVFGLKSKSDLYKLFLKEINSHRFTFPRSERATQTIEYVNFIKQMGELQKGYRGQYLTVSHPTERDARDDFADSAALAVYGCSYTGYTMVARTESKNPFTERTDNERQSIKSVNRLTARRR